MSRVSQARRIASAAALGGGGIGVVGVAGFGLLGAQAALARRWIGRPFGQAHDIDGQYGSGPGQPYELAMLGDSSAAGLGVSLPEDTPAARLARGLASTSGRPVRLTCVAEVGAESAGLGDQVDRLFATVPSPDVAVIMVGGNDVTHRVRPPDAVRFLTDQVHRLRDAGAVVVVGTCPDLGTIKPISQPLRYVARRWSRQLAAAQTVAVVEAGGRTVSLADLLGPEFEARPEEFFSADRFHPSEVGYARAADALLPSVCAALGLWPDGGAERAPDAERGEGVAPVAEAAVQAADVGGTEVAPLEVPGPDRGPFGRWAVLLRRRRSPGVPAPRARPESSDSSDASDAPSVASTSAPVGLAAPSALVQADPRPRPPSGGSP